MMKRRTSLIVAGALAAAAATLVLAKTGAITVKGSDTMVILAQRWAEQYMAAHSDVTVQVTGGGSGVGISALINGTTDICNSSRPMTMSEREKLKQRYNSMSTCSTVAVTSLTLMPHLPASVGKG